MDSNGRKFYTVRGYDLLHQEEKLITHGMEDYLEMICRLCRNKGYTRVRDLAAKLNVQPPSASKMVQKLSELGLLNYQKYGLIELTDKGRELGFYLLQRHETIEEFLKIIGVEQGVLEDTEKIEHNVSPQTMEQIIVLVRFFSEKPNLIEKLRLYRENQSKP